MYRTFPLVVGATLAITLSACGQSNNDALQTQNGASKTPAPVIDIKSLDALPTDANPQGWRKVAEGTWEQVKTDSTGVYISRYTTGQSLEGLRWMLQQHLSDLERTKQLYPEALGNQSKPDEWRIFFEGAISNFGKNMKALATPDCTVNATAGPSGSYVVGWALGACAGGAGTSVGSGAEFNGQRVTGNQVPYSSGGRTGYTSQANAYSSVGTPTSSRDCARGKATTGSVFNPGPSIERLWGTAYTNAYACPTF